MTLDVGEALCQKGFRVWVICRKFRKDLMPKDSPILVLTHRHKLKKKACAKELIDLIRENGIEVLTYMCIDPLWLPLIKAKTGVKVVVANHGVPFWNVIGKYFQKEALSRGKLWQRLRWKYYYVPRFANHTYEKKYQRGLQRIFANIDAYTVLCDAYGEQIVNALSLPEVEARKIRVIPNFQEPNETPVLEKERVVLFVGRLTYADKRVDRLLRIWSHVEAQGEGWRLLIVGDGEELPRLQALARELALRHVSFEGRQHPQAYYDRAAILCLTSTMEGWGLVLTEAQTNGVVPIAFNCSAGVEYILAPSGMNGILVEPFDEEAYATQLLRLMQDEGLRSGMQHNVLQRQYPKSEVCRRYIELYTELLET